MQKRIKRHSPHPQNKSKEVKRKIEMPTKANNFTTNLVQAFCSHI